MSEQIVIVGAGQAGSCAAIAMRKAGSDASIVLIGAEAERPYERPPLSKEVLTAAESKCPYLVTAERYEELDVSLRLGHMVTEIDPAARRIRLSRGENIAYDRLLIATGGRPRRLSVPGSEHIRYLRTYADALALRRVLRGAERVVCIGAGVIGLEIAASASSLSCQVIVLESGSSVMGRCLAVEDAVFVADLHRMSGVELRLSHSVAAIETRPDGALMVVSTDGTAERADCIVAGIGMERDAQLAAVAGASVDEGILVDEGGRTNVSGIFAAGDVAALWHPAFQRHVRFESWHHAQNHGNLVGRVMTGADESYEEIPRFWTDQHGVNIQVAGRPTEASRVVLRGSRADRRYTAFHLDEGGHVIGVTSVNNPRNMRPALEMIRSSRRPDESDLADPNRPLR